MYRALSILRLQSDISQGTVVNGLSPAFFGLAYNEYNTDKSI